MQMMKSKGLFLYQRWYYDSPVIKCPVLTNEKKEADKRKFIFLITERKNKKGEQIRDKSGNFVYVFEPPKKIVKGKRFDDLYEFKVKPKKYEFSAVNKAEAGRTFFMVLNKLYNKKK